jgi:feruloyl esterase
VTLTWRPASIARPITRGTRNDPSTARPGHRRRALDGDRLAHSGYGGKLLIYEGWADPVVSPYDTIGYYRRVVRATSGGRRSGDVDATALRRTQEFARLFMVSGMTHCGGGPGPNTFDKLTPLVRWVEHAAAPQKITATKYVNDTPSQGVALTRELRPLSELSVPGGSCM